MLLHPSQFYPGRLVAAATAVFLGLAGGSAGAQQVMPEDWPAIVAEADGQTVYWHTWGGSAAVNAYIDWVAEEVASRHNVTLEHVRLADTAEAVSRVIAERAAGRDTGGAVDLIWINGENFAAMKEQDLLFGPWVEALPNWRFVDPEGNPAVVSDFTVPTDGLEAPWGLARLVFFHDAARTSEPPRSIVELGQWADANPGRFAFPQPPEFLGSTFLKQALIELVSDPSVLQDTVSSVDYEQVTAPLWAFMDALTPNLWRGGAAYPQSGPRLIQLMADGEIDLALSFDAYEAERAIAYFQLPASVETYVLDGGTIGNASFVAIPYNANAAAGAMVVANFLLSPQAQARMQNPEIWGSGTVLSLDRLEDEDRAWFEAIPQGGSLGPFDLGAVLPEPHPSWMERLEEDWIARYGVAR